MSAPQLVSVILSTYNSPRYLALALQALGRQSCSAYEVVVADDGSGEETRQLIAAMAESFPVALKHAWHEDKGFRAAAARNNAVRAASGDYLVFLDGDCLARPSFIEAHRHHAEPGFMLRGSRLMLHQGFTEKVFAGTALPQNFLQWLGLRLRGGVKRIASLLPLPFVRYRKRRDWDGVKTCNLGVWRSDFESVNGFDERYIGWGHEDADLAVRLLRYGVQRKEGRAAIPVVHLWHEENDRGRLSENTERLQQVIRADYTVAEQGLGQ